MKRLIILIFSLCLFASVEGQIIRANPFARAQVSAGGSNLSDGLVSIWELDEDSGGTSADSFGDNDGTIDGATQGTDAVLDDGVTFGGDGDNVTIAHDASLSITGTISIAAWVYLSGTGNNVILCKQYGGGDGSDVVPYKFAIMSHDANNNPQMTIYNGGFIHVISTRSLNVETWYHVGVTLDAGNNSCIFYINGVGEDAQTGITAIPTNTQSVMLGRYATGGENLNGILDQVVLWNTIKTSDDFVSLYNSGNGLAYTSW